ncbi:hypothetical protein KY336_04030 [Candidatus Woesearchaeota archaeon]|nr:hypothetical protein [Candidatus Woesearchaeota archaeon]
MDPDNRPKDFPKTIPRFFNANRMTTPNFVVSRYPKRIRESMFEDLDEFYYYPEISLDFPDLEYSAMRRISPAYTQPVVKAEFDLIMAAGGEFVYSLRNVLIQEFASPATFNKFVLFLKLPDLSTWSEKRLTDYRELLQKRQAEIEENTPSYLSEGVSVYNQDPEHDNVNSAGRDRMDLMYDVIDNLCDSPWSPMAIEGARKYLDEETRLITGRPAKIGEAGDFLKRAFRELKATERFAKLDELERNMLEKFLSRDYDSTQNLLYQRTLDWHRRSLLLLIKNNVYLNGKGKEVDWSLFNQH